MNADIGTRLRSLAIERVEVPEEPEPRRRPASWIVSGLLAVISTGALGVAAYVGRGQILSIISHIGHEAPTHKDQATIEPPSSPQPQTSSMSAIVGSGYVVAERMVTIRPDIAGRIVELPIDVGERVVAGHQLALMDTKTAQIQLEIAKSQQASALVAARRVEVSLTKAQKTQNRTTRLAGQGIVSENTMDADSLAVQQLEQDLQSARQAVETAKLLVAAEERILALHEIVAPFDGVVAELLTGIGDTLAAGTDGVGPRDGVAILLDPRSLVVDVDVAQTNASRVTPGGIATAVIDAFPRHSFQMRIRAILPAASAQKGTVTVRLDFIDPPQNVLPNMSLKVTFGDAKASSPSEMKGTGNG